VAYKKIYLHPYGDASKTLLDFRVSGSKEAERKFPHQRGEAALKAFPFFFNGKLLARKSGMCDKNFRQASSKMGRNAPWYWRKAQMSLKPVPVRNTPHVIVGLNLLLETIT
jgi:hypothetical protein